METFASFVARHKGESNGLRLGQRFVNEYLPKWQGPEASYLFSLDGELAAMSIKTFLQVWHYWPDMPPRAG